MKKLLLIFCCAVLAPAFTPILSPGQVSISEIMYHPNSERVEDEFIELFNETAFPIVLDGWAFTQGINYTFTNSTLAASGYLVVAADLNAFTSRYPAITNVVGNWTGQLSNRGEEILLEDATGATADRVIYADEGDWAKRVRGAPDSGHEGWDWQADHDGGGKSLERINPLRSNNYGQNWGASLTFDGTPGLVNSLLSTNTAPFILEVEHIPVLPTATDPVNVIARVLDHQPGFSATLHYRRDGVSSFSAITMTDDGLHNDGTANDGYYGATVPPHALNDVIEFYIESTGANAQVRTWPEAIGDATKLLGAWRLDETGGTLAFDRSGFGNTAILTNGAQFVTNGVYGAAIQLDGVDDYVILEPDLGSSPPLGAARFTIALWFQRNGSGSNANTGSGGINAEPLLTKGRGESDGNIRDANYFLGLRQVGGDYVLASDYEEHALSNDPGNNNPLTGTTPILDGQWYHAAMVFDLGTVRLYLDGVLEAELATTSTPNFDSIQPAAIGTALNSNYTPQGYFNGLIDDPIVYQGSLDATQVNNIKDDLPIVAPPPPQLANCLYQVTDPSDISEQPLYRLIMTAAEYAERQAIGRNGTSSRSKAQMNATFISQEPGRIRCRYLVGLRNRGNGSRTYQPNNQRVNFRSDDMWNGIDAINFNARHTYLQALGSSYFQLADMIAGDAQPAQFRMNNDNNARPGSAMFGSYAKVEVIDGDYVEHWIPDDDSGNLYRGIRISSPGANLRYQGTSTNDYRVNYFKQTNTSEDDWSDLIELTDVLNNTPDNLYTQEVSRVVNERQWLRWLAIQTMFDNSETNLSNGDGDDYYFYRGVNDPRFILLPHDFDTILGDGDTAGSPTRTLFRFFGIPALERLFKFPDYSPIYFEHLLDICNLFESDTFENIMQEEIGYIPDGTSDTLRSFMQQRIAHVRSEIPVALTANSGTPFANNFYTTTNSVISFTGNAHAVNTHSVTLNGSNATWTAWTASWTFDDYPLVPGINRIYIETFGRDGELTEQLAVDVYRNDVATTIIGGTLTNDLVLAASASPYQVTSDIVVPDGFTLTVEPGVDLLFDDGVRLTVNGRLVAEGTRYDRIQFTRAPGSTDAWDGIFFAQSINDSRLVNVDIAYATASSQSLSADASQVLLDGVTFAGTLEKILELDNPSVIIRNVFFPSIGGSETIHGSGLTGNEYLIIEGCTFGSGIGYNDIIDFTGGRRPGPIIQVYNNLFLGASDDVLDLDGTDAHIEGNIFRNIHTDDPSRDSTANAIATDDFSDLMVVRNYFFDIDHALLLKNHSRAIFHHNTVVNATLAAINFDEPVRSGVVPGDYVRIDGCIFQDCVKIFENQFSSNGEADPIPTVNRSLIPAIHHALGSDNLDADAQLIDPPNDFRLRVTSPAHSNGLLGLDRGADVPRWCTVGNLPQSDTSTTQLTLPVYGPGVTNFVYRVNNGPYSAEQAIDQPIVLSGLTNGTYTLYLLGQNSAQVWQSESNVTVTASFTVNTNAPAQTGGIVINEILADNKTAVEHQGSFPDLIELYNPTDAAVNLAGYQLSDNASTFTFPTGIVLKAKSFMTLYANTNSVNNEVHLGFSLNDKGEPITLYDANTQLVDAVTYGWQIIDHSIGRNAHGQWALCNPTFGSSNQAVGTGDPYDLRINEWLAAPDGLFVDDFIELYNSANQPTLLGGLYLSDDPVGRKDRYRIPDLSFIDARGYRIFIADDNEDRGPDHLNFNLDANEGWIALYNPTLAEIDRIFYGPQKPDGTSGRSPSGANALGTLPIPSPGAGNPAEVATGSITSNLFDYTDVWKYDETDTAFGNDWRTLGFNDSTWLSGPGLLYVEGSSLPEAKSTPLTLGNITYYFRKTFVFDGDPAKATLALSTMVDDGAVVYLNSNEVFRIGFDPGTVVTHGVDADRTAGNATYEGPFDIPTTHLTTGTNIVAVQVHQADINSSDVVWGAKVDVTTETFGSISLNEVFAYNRTFADADGSFPDWVELYNPGPDAFNLGGMSLTDNFNQPQKFVFPSNTLVAADGYLIVRCNSSLPASSTNTGFGFDWEGDGVYLFDAVVNGAALRDGITFGTQVPDHSLSRDGNGNGPWSLGLPTLGGSNTVVPLGNAHYVKINEWLAAGSNEEDWFELYNPSGQPIKLSGMHLSDELLQRDAFKIAPHSFLGFGTNGYLRFVADDNLEQGAHHTSFKLSKSGESIGVFAHNLVQVERISFGAQVTDVTQGRLPNGSGLILDFPGTPTPGAPNTGADNDMDGIPDAWETAYGLNPLLNDALLDLDGDGQRNLAEYLSGTLPHQFSSVMKLQAKQFTGSGMLLGLETVLGKSYTIECTEDPISGPWQKVVNLPFQPQSSEVELTDPNVADPGRKVYRAVTPAY